MSTTTPRRLPALLVMLLLLIPFSAVAEVVRIEIHSRVDLVGGKTFGSVGPYEKVAGLIHFAVDPDNPANRIIADIALAPRNADGRVEFSSDFYLIKPKDITRGNGTVLYEVSNRGGKGMLRFFNRGSGSRDPKTDADMGDGFLMRHGFTLLWVGWQFDVPRRDGVMRLYTPVATEGGDPITGLVRSEIVVSEQTADRSLADRSHVAYEVADPTDPANVMTWRESPNGPRRVVPRDTWRFARVEDGRVVPDRTRVYLEGGFEPHVLYDVVYLAQNPPLVGLGPAAVRDTISHLKYGSDEQLVMSAGSIVRAMAYGSSQSGRFLRTFLYHGFNEDEGHRKAFDGVMAHIAGAGRGSFNHRFAQPSRDGHPFLNALYPTDIFPFSDIVQRDPETDMRDGLLDGIEPAFMPRVFYTNSSYEYWGRSASLIHTTVNGSDDMPLMDNVHIYSFAGGQHGPGRFPPVQTTGQQLSNPNDYSWFMRSLVLSMNRWVSGDDTTPPPPSRYPRIDDGDLVRPVDLEFPAVPGVGSPGPPQKAYRVVYGPEFRTRGIVTVEPPEVLSEFPILVPQVDPDGNETGGLMMPEVAVPLATYTGWNLFRPESGPPNVLSSMQGSYIPFPRTKADRMRTADPRRSIAERYAGKPEYLDSVSASAMSLVSDGYLLAEDVSSILAQAGRHWDYPMTDTP